MLIIKHNKIILLGIFRGITHHICLHLPHHHPQPRLHLFLIRPRWTLFQYIYNPASTTLSPKSWEIILLIPSLFLTQSRADLSTPKTQLSPQPLHGHVDIPLTTLNFSASVARNIEHSLPTPPLVPNTSGVKVPFSTSIHLWL